MPSKNNKLLKKIGWLILITFIIGNFIAYNQAYKFTHFSEVENERTKRPEELSILEKLNTLFLGINIPKPKNTAKPSFPFETIKLQSHETLEAWHVKIPNAKGTVVLFHGYSSSKSGVLPYSHAFNEKGYSTFLVDFMGSGGSEGNTTTVGFKESRDVKEAFDYLKKQNPNEKIVLFGSSMGAISIMKAIEEYDIKPEKIILECPFGSFLKTTKRRFEAMNLPSFPLAEILLFYGGLQTGFNAFQHNPTEYAKAIKVPTLLLFGANDKRVTSTGIDKIFDNLTGEKELVIMENSGHEIYLNNDAEKWHIAVDNFIK